MSLQAQPIPPIPELTTKVARRAFRKGNLYMQMRNTLGTFFTDDQFTDLYPADGQPAYGPLATGAGQRHAVRREPDGSPGRRRRAFAY